MIFTGEIVGLAEGIIDGIHMSMFSSFLEKVAVYKSHY